MFMAGTQVHSATPAPKSYDLDGDGAISILDMAVLAQHFGELVGTPVPCIDRTVYLTPEPVYDSAGALVALVTGRVWVPTEHPEWLSNLQGTPLSARPCG